MDWVPTSYENPINSSTTSTTQGMELDATSRHKRPLINSDNSSASSLKRIRYEVSKLRVSSSPSHHHSPSSTLKISNSANKKTDKNNHYSSKAATEVLLRNLQDVLMGKDDLNLSVELINDDIYHWKINISLKNNTQLMDTSRLQEVVLRARFPPNFPAEPPRIYLVQPKGAAQNLLLDADGSILLDELTSSSWSSKTDLKALLSFISSVIFEPHNETA
eukprot:TRINITY_DN17351_c0_g1_i1.p1 TRINITY_DN17351_c0_g1~~TRINITY_DN17351_c0_g1_i1.p1  ORF type:complete len:219 (+),score=45.10 TRINITY_DN17351_c0_g1_i1:3-659(+)